MLLTRRSALGLGALSGLTSARPGVFGHSVQGRDLRVHRRGSATAGHRVLVVGCIHGNETAGIGVVEDLLTRTAPAGTALWVVRSVNPDGQAAGTRHNARGVDLNRNFPGWRPDGGRPFDTYYPGPRASSEPETRAVESLLATVRPTVAIWFHQHLDCVDVHGRVGTAHKQAYARRAGLPARAIPPPAGAVTVWQDRLRHIAFVVELPSVVPPAMQRRHAGAVVALARDLS